MVEEEEEEEEKGTERMDFTKIADRLNRIWLTLKTPPPSPQTSAVVVAGDNAAAPTSTTTSAAAAAISTGAGGDHQHHQQQLQSPIAEEVGGDLKSTGDKVAEDMSAAATASKLVKSAYPKQQVIIIKF